MTQFIKTLLRLLIILLLPEFGIAQASTYLPQGSTSDHFLDRLGILMQSNPDLNIFTPKPLSGKVAVSVSELADSLFRANPIENHLQLSAVDQFNLQDLLMNNTEWVTGSKESFKSKHPIWKTFYNTKANFVEVNEKDFFLALNPVLQLQESKESGNDERVFVNSKGLTFRGRIGQHLAFSSFITDNQERGPSFFQERVTASGYPAVPGAGYYKPFKTTAFDYYDARGSINFDAWKYVDFQFGYDKNFIGNGYRSLFLSDYSAPYLFLKVNTRIWKINYYILYMELISQHQKGDYQYPKKYGVMHHLSFNATKWLNVGMFDNVMFSRADHFDFSYLNPIIFLASAQQQNGSPDKTTVGFDFKANIAHSVKLYGQLLFNEFVLHEILHYGDGWWGNKQGIQFGVKYVNAFNLKNLDLQVETNLMRPYTYSHNDTVANYSNYNQPMAHPLGANFAEIIGIARYQPFNKWNIEAKLIYYKQGLDSAGVNFGSNILEDYNTRPRDYGFKIGSGSPSYCLNASGLVSFEVLDNFFIDFSLMYRWFKSQDILGVVTTTGNATITAGIRINMFRKQYDY